MEEFTVEAIKAFEYSAIKNPGVSVKLLFRLMYEMLGANGFHKEQREFETYYIAVCKRGERK